MGCVRYEGQFVSGVREDPAGVQVFANGDRYEGGFAAGKRTGRGKLLWANGAAHGAPSVWSMCL